MILLSGDWHLDEDPDNEYRWDIFNRVREIAKKYAVSHIYCLGDLLDRKDRFSAQFVNRLIGELRETAELVPLWVLRGNHDSPLRGPAFFEFVNGLVPRVHYVTGPLPQEIGKTRLILLPHAAHPAEAWRGIHWRDFDAALMHVTVAGAVMENGFRLTAGQRLPPLPRELKIYSGDVHTPQVVRNITYIGAPHPTKFGDTYPCRVLLIDEHTLEIAHEIPLEVPRKHVFEISSVDELPQVQPGDRAKIRFHLPSTDLERWGELESELAAWAKLNGVEIAGIEAIVAGSARELDLDAAPEALLREFAQVEGISDDLLATGLTLLKEATG
jgi:DNA repair exonuclease SbcCD nuclease subunit